MIAYIISAYTNSGEFFKDVPPGVLCPVCNTCIDKLYYPKKLIMSHKYDISSTNDGRLIFSERFKSFCLNEKLKGINFYEVRANPNFYYLLTQNIIEFDTERISLKISEKCPICLNHRDVCGLTPAFIKNNNIPLKRGIYRTDLEFGSGYEKEFALIIDIETAEKIKYFKFKGFIFIPVES
jgi:hypothetical protein